MFRPDFFCSDILHSTCHPLPMSNTCPLSFCMHFLYRKNTSGHLLRECVFLSAARIRHASRCCYFPKVCCLLRAAKISGKGKSPVAYQTFFLLFLYEIPDVVLIVFFYSFPPAERRIEIRLSRRQKSVHHLFRLPEYITRLYFKTENSKCTITDRKNSINDIYTGSVRSADCSDLSGP